MFGCFVGVGVLFAWAITILFVPAYIMLLPERVLHNFGMAAQQNNRVQANADALSMGKASSTAIETILVIL